MAAILLGFALAASTAQAEDRLRDEPVVWYSDDRSSIQGEIAEREPPIGWDAYTDGFVRPLGRWTNPGRLVRKFGTIFGGDPVLPAANVNRLDEVVNSTWFTNRIAFFDVSPEAVARGPIPDGAPDFSEVWVIVRAKTEGVTPGFTIRDARGRVYLIKFDPPGYLNMTTAAGVISNRIFYGAGYNVPGDYSVVFDRGQVVLGEGVKMPLPGGGSRVMTQSDVDSLLHIVARQPDGRWRGLASRYLDGQPVGPFDYKGKRKDDPNDRIDHEDRRELRGMYVLAAWLNHYDTKQQNSLDMLIEDGEARYIKHHLIDFASTVGAGARAPVQRYGYEFTFDLPPITGRILALGFHDDPWRYLQRPEGLPEVGYWESDIFHPNKFKPLQPNTAFANRTDRDGYWGAKIVSAFTDAHLEAIVDEANYIDPASSSYVLRVLIERRDKIARYWFERKAPLDYFRWQRAGGDDRIRFDDLGQQRGLYPGTAPRYRVRLRAVNASGKSAGHGDWVEATAPEVDVAQSAAAVASAVEFPFFELECRVDRGDGLSPVTRAYFARGSRRVIGVER